MRQMYGNKKAETDKSLLKKRAACRRLFFYYTFALQDIMVVRALCA